MNLIKNLALGLMATASLASCHAKGNVSLELPKGSQAPDSVVVSYVLMDDLLNATRDNQPDPVNQTIALGSEQTSFSINAPSAAQYSLYFPGGQMVQFYAEPQDQLKVDVSQLAPEFQYTVTGSELMDGIAKLNKQTKPIEDEYARLIESNQMTEQKRNELGDAYDAASIAFIKENANNSAAPYALMVFDGPEYMELFDLLGPGAKSSMLYPFAAKKAERVKVALEKEKKQAEMQDGTHEAPGFTLNNLEGKKISLSDFRGKYVVLDFWGSWCPWCIKGFPALKEAYEKYKDQLVIVGVDCQDSPEQWKEAVKKHALPWVNVYNPKGGDITDLYGVSGFPTKVIINPEGKIVNITVGEDPAFFTTLAGFLGR